MFTLQVQYQENFSKSKLLLRIFFGVLYIAFPHLIAVFLFTIWGKWMWVYSVFVVLITGKLPENIFNYQIKLLKWLSRIYISVYNLTDEYPEFWLSGNSSSLTINAAYNETPNRLTTLFRLILAPLIFLPHLLVWWFRNLISIVLGFLAFWVVLFTGKYPKKWFDFNVGTLRWMMRLVAYMFLITDDYPPFSGKE